MNLRDTSAVRRGITEPRPLGLGRRQTKPIPLCRRPARSFSEALIKRPTLIPLARISLTSINLSDTICLNENIFDQSGGEETRNRDQDSQSLYRGKQSSATQNHRRGW